MRYLSLFSGVEAASVAWAPLGWEPLAFCEVDEFPAAVLAHRFPHVPNLGDVCKVDWKEFHERYGTVDVLVGGSPCQSFSIAGNREGLSGESRLMFEYIRAVRDLVRASGGGSPRYVLWENVPGALSSEGGDAFGQLLAELDELGYGLAWRVLDAQYVRVPGGPRGGFFGPVAQRRRRVFLVGVLGSPHASEILFERACLRGDNPTGREARQAIASDPAEGVAGGDCAGFKYHQGSAAGNIGYGDVSPTLATDYHAPAVLMPWDVWSKRVYSEDGISPTLQASSGKGMTIQPIVMTTANTNANGSNVSDDGISYTLDRSNSNAVGYSIPENAVNRPTGGTNGPMAYGLDEASPTLRASKDVPAVAFAQNSRDEVRLQGGDGQVVGALSAQPGMKQTSYVMTQYGEVAGTLSSRGDSNPCADRGQNVVCMADDNGKAAVDEDMAGSLKVGGGRRW